MQASSQRRMEERKAVFARAAVSLFGCTEESASASAEDLDLLTSISPDMGLGYRARSESSPVRTWRVPRPLLGPPLRDAVQIGC